MSQLTNFAENKLIDALLRGQAIGTPANWFVALFTSAVVVDDTGAGTEASYTGYARVSVAASLANFAGTQGAGTTVASTGTGGQTSNNAAITFGAPTAGGPQTMRYFALMDASTGGNMWIYGQLTADRVLNNGDAAPSFAIGALTITAA